MTDLPPRSSSPFAHPWVNLALCAVCVYAGILAAMVCLAAKDKTAYFFAAAFSFIAAFRLFQNFLKVKKS
ncbi:hypothetical protein [Mesoterricola silvestris]|uniref:Uncharacterized protein n=1 Tax=Mesoterricola silvestris TaxID=2927979 RepID=A0AA48K9G0_9BACT|nr:hypothetical protein [Mesoterricola silvestris]BDU72292.1 hypothetical protein METEAL_14660 [Mesoterricola silvestris]